jgi:hypothetical protein
MATLKDLVKQRRPAVKEKRKKVSFPGLLEDRNDSGKKREDSQYQQTATYTT